MADRSPAERLDHAVDLLLADGDVSTERELHPLLTTADRVRLALGPVPVSPQFEAALAQRVARRREPIWHGHIPSWLLLSGAVSSAAVGVGVTAYAVWRGTRRANGHRLVSR